MTPQKALIIYEGTLKIAPEIGLQLNSKTIVWNEEEWDEEKGEMIIHSWTWRKIKDLAIRAKNLERN